MADTMPLTSGTYTVGPEQGTLRVRTKRGGAAARAGHDLVMEATGWTATDVADAETPANSSLDATVDAGSLVVREASGGAMAITDSQREEIVRNTRAKVLHAERYPEITARSTSVSGTASRAVVAVDLTIAGKTRPANLYVSVSDSAGAVAVTASTSVLQTAFGITPYSALFGTLKVKDEVEIVIETRVPAR